jgi:hypothetical protein
LCMDFDWRSHHVIYHGWNRPGWVNNARPYIHVPNVNVNRSRSSINQTWRHDMSHGDPEKFRASQPGSVSAGGVVHTPDVRGRETTQVKRTGVIFGPKGDTSSFSNRGKQSLGTISQRQTDRISRQPSMPASGPTAGIIRGSSQSRPAGESIQPPKTPSVTFGGYRGSSEARAQSLRGQSSRRSGTETRPSVQSPNTSSAPASRGSAPGGKSSSGERRGR